MSKIDIEFYSQFAPVLSQPGWYETGAYGFGDCFFRNVVHQESGLIITVGIVICPGSWHYCANFTTPGSGQGLDLGSQGKLDTLEWEQLRDLVKQKGLAAYKIHLDRLDREIEKEDLKSRSRHQAN